MRSFTCALIGDESLLAGCGDALLARGHGITAVVTTDPGIMDWAAANKLGVLASPQELQPGFDWLLSIANLRVIPDRVLALASKGAVNFHDGPLPAYAGLNAPNWALVHGETRYGISWHMLEGGIDEGDLLAQRLFDVAPDETAFTLNSKCYAAAMDSFGDVIAQLESSAPQRQAQDLSLRSYFAKADRPAAGGRLDFTRPSEELARLVRALDFGGYWNPLCAAKFKAAGHILLARTAASAEGNGSPGTVLDVASGSLTLATGDGALRLGGITRVAGQPVSLKDIVAKGSVLPMLATAEAVTLTGRLAATQKGEPRWRKALTAMQPLPVPLASATGETGQGSCSVAMPANLQPNQIAAVVLGWALLSSGEEYGDIALSDAAMASAAQPELISGWVPLQASGKDITRDLLNRLSGDLAAAHKLGGFAADLPARDPAIIATGQPAIGLMLDADAPVEGCAVTMAFCDGKAVLHWDKAQISAQAADLLAARLCQAFKGLSELGDQPLAALQILPEDERRKILTDWNTTGREYQSSLTIHAAVEAQSARTPDAPALVFEDQSLTYAQLNARANATAAQLQNMGVKPGSHVGLYVKRGPALVIGALAILKAGGAYVPLDPAYPADRIAHYLKDSQAQVILSEAALMDSLPASQAQVLDIATVPAPATTGANTQSAATGADLAYLIYTSGSTGTPKGVMVSHRNVANFFAGMDDRIPHSPGDTWLAVTSLSFDISVLELFWTLSRGFKLVLSSDESRLLLSNGPIRASDRKMDFNLFYWGNDDGPGRQKYRLLLEGAKFADSHGFNAVWTPERHFHAFGGPYPNPSVTGAAVAAVTENLSVRAGSCVAPLHHPARIAEEWSVIDNITNGRAGLGIAAGWQPDDFVLRPENAPPNNKSAMFETIETLRKLWRGEAVEFPRADGSMHPVVTQPRPVSKELPLWVTTAGNPATWREAGEIGANVLTHLLGQSIEEVAGKIKIYHDALRGAGHDPADHKVTLMLHTYLDKTREEARRIAREPMKDYLRSAAGLIKQYAWAFPAFKKPEGVSNAYEMNLDILSEEELEAILDFAFERYFEDSGLFGTVQDGLQRVEELKRIGVDEIACLIDYGIAPDVVLDALTPLAEVLRLSNAPVDLAEDDFSLAAQILRHGVTHMQCTPSMARMIAMDDEAKLALARLEHLLVGGEALPGDLTAALHDLTHGQIHNMYGPTETTIWSTVDRLEAAPEATANIGVPIANTSVYVLNAADEPQPIGAPGELLIGGEGVTSGYWQRPDLTEERFIPDPFAGSGTLYRTGDLVRWRIDGKLDFLGRTDHQVKIRGQRIELGEIEAAMAAFPGVTGAVAVTRQIGEGERLVGYVTAPSPVNEAALKAQLAQELAEVMVPAHIVNLEAFPLTPNKKIDRKALPDPRPTRPTAATVAPAPAQGAQAQVAEVWSRILGVEGIRTSDNFFALGGHSLLAVQAHREIRKETGAARLSITDIFRFPTLEGLAAHLDGLAGTGTAAEPAQPMVDTEARTETMSKRRAMRANRKARAG